VLEADCVAAVLVAAVGVSLEAERGPEGCRGGVEREYTSPAGGAGLVAVLEAPAVPMGGLLVAGGVLVAGGACLEAERRRAAQDVASFTPHTQRLTARAAAADPSTVLVGRAPRTLAAAPALERVARPLTACLHSLES
jgi:hypothetical protein